MPVGKRQITNGKMCKGPDHTCHKKDIQMSNKHIKIAQTYSNQKNAN